MTENKSWDLKFMDEGYNNGFWCDEDEKGIWICEKELKEFYTIPSEIMEATLLWSASPLPDCWKYRIAALDHIDFKRPDGYRYESFFVATSLVESLPKKGYLAITWSF